MSSTAFPSICSATASNAAAPRVIVVGGGLAGIAAAAALASAGIRVSLLEARSQLGGRAGSFEDAPPHQLLDNCQHVLLGCCTNLIDLYRRLGTADKIQYRNRIHYLDENGRRYDLWSVPSLPAPLHLAPALAVFGALRLSERFAVCRAIWAMLRLGRAGRESLANVPFGLWLREQRQPERVIRRFYDPILISALNEQTESASGKYAIQVFQDAMLSHRRGYMIGLPVCPLEKLYALWPCEDVRLHTRVSELSFDGNRVTGVILRNGQRLSADAVVLAANYHAVLRWIPEHLRRVDSRFAHLDQLQNVPILGAHLWFDRPVMRLPFAALFDPPLQWLFRKDERGAVLHGVISAARPWVDTPAEKLMLLFRDQIQRLFSVPEAQVIRYRIIIEKRATFSPRPGVDAHRPPQAPPPAGVENLFLAGDYTQTDWPATMEGAVRSGYLAAEKMLQAFGTTGGVRRFLVDDLPPEFPMRFLAANNRV